MVTKRKTTRKRVGRKTARRTVKKKRTIGTRKKRLIDEIRFRKEEAGMFRELSRMKPGRVADISDDFKPGAIRRAIKQKREAREDFAVTKISINMLEKRLAEGKFNIKTGTAPRRSFNKMKRKR